MKKYITISILSLLAFATIYRCNDLDLEPLNRLSEAAYYKTAADFDGAIFAVYSATQDYFGPGLGDGTSGFTGGTRMPWQKLVGLTDDDMFQQYTNDSAYDAQILQGSSDPEATLSLAFRVTYKGIYRANLILKKIEEDDVDLTEAKKATYIAEAKFLRAFFHFQAMKLWGNPPLVTEVAENLATASIPNSTSEALYAAILSDFEAAFTGLPLSWDDSNKGRATKWAAKAYVGKVNVWKQDWTAATSAFQEVVGSGAFALESNYDDVFAWDNENNIESIFEIQASGNFDGNNNIWVMDDTEIAAQQGMLRPFHFGISNQLHPGGNAVVGWRGGWGQLWAATKEIEELFEPGDKRFPVSLYAEGDDYIGMPDGKPTEVFTYTKDWMHTAKGTNIKKYMGPRNSVTENYSSNGGTDYSNHRWFRYGGMLLLYAEALIQSGNTSAGMDIINNQIRSRAGLGATTEADPIKALIDERRRELAFEYHRIFDVQRWGIGAQVFGNWDSRFRYFPMPQREIDASKGELTQSPGW